LVRGRDEGDASVREAVPGDEQEFIPLPE